MPLHLYEDPRCPVCEDFESTGGGPELVEATVRGEVRTQCTMASFESVGDTPHKGPGTPTAVINKVRIPADYSGVLYDATAFSNVLELIRRSPEEWEGYEFPEVQTPPSLS